MKRSLLVILPLLAGCADYSASQYQPTSALAIDRRAAFDECNRATWQTWGSQPHPAAAFGALGALFDASATAAPAQDQMAQCMLARGYAKAGL